jgi:hypothetical protein
MAEGEYPSEKEKTVSGAINSGNGAVNKKALSSGSAIT